MHCLWGAYTFRAFSKLGAPLVFGCRLFCGAKNLGVPEWDPNLGNTHSLVNIWIPQAQASTKKPV